MSDNLILEMLHAIRSDLSETRTDLQDIARRTTMLEMSLLAYAVQEAGHHARLCARMDRLSDRLDTVGGELDQRYGRSN